MNLEFSAEEKAFQQEVREWLAENTPRGAAGFTMEREPMMAWEQKLASKGWLAVSWPKQYGGPGWTPTQRYIWDEECARAGAPTHSVFGINMCGPVIMAFGTPEQKEEHLPPIANGTRLWCQGYSEPGSGSDLASLKTRAERDGDEYVVNGQKIWTTAAHISDWIFCLVRTSQGERKQEGISFLLIDMKSPGVEVRPILLINGGSPFCETFFTDVKVPKGNLVGEPGKGWEIAKRLLQYERINISKTGFGSDRSAGLSLPEVAKKYVGVKHGVLADTDLRARITKNEMYSDAFNLTIQRNEAQAKAGGDVGPATSIVKYAAATMNKEKTELQVEALGLQALGWEGEGFKPGEIASTRAMLRAKGNSIEGGTSEINLNVVAKRVLGLRDHQ